MHFLTETCKTLATCILILLTTACSGDGSLSPSMSVAGTYVGPLEIFATGTTSSGDKMVFVTVTYSLRLTVSQFGAQLRITGSITPPDGWEPNEPDQFAITRMINPGGSTSGGIFASALAFNPTPVAHHGILLGRNNSGERALWREIHPRGFLDCTPATMISATLAFSENTMQVSEIVSTSSCGDITISGILVME